MKGSNKKVNLRIFRSNCIVKLEIICEEYMHIINIDRYLRILTVLCVLFSLFKVECQRGRFPSCFLRGTCQISVFETSDCLHWLQNYRHIVTLLIIRFVDAVVNESSVEAKVTKKEWAF